MRGVKRLLGWHRFWLAGGSTFSLVLLAQGCPFLPTGTEFPVAEVLVVAEPASFELGETSHATATLKDSDGNVLTDIEVSWSSSNGSVATVTPNGDVTTAVVRGQGEGIATITASAEGKSGSAAVLVTPSEPSPPPPPPPPAVNSVVVALSSSGLNVGGTTQAAATLRDADGNVLSGRAVSWSSGNSSVATVSSSSGTTAVVTAVSAGSAQIIATSEGKSGSASITVTGDAPPTGSSNEPAGFSVITNRAFDLLEEDGWRAEDVEVTGGITIQPDITGPKSAPLVGRFYYPAGFPSGYETGQSWKVITSYGYTKLYISFWIKLSSNFYGHPVQDKLGYVWTHGRPVVFPSYVGTGMSALHSQVRIGSVPADMGSTNFDPNLTNPEIRRGEWVHWELLLLNNTGDNFDGQIHWWINGTKAGEYKSVKFSSASQSKAWESLELDPIWGGCCATVPYDMFLWVDHYYASGAR